MLQLGKYSCDINQTTMISCKNKYLLKKFKTSCGIMKSGIYGIYIYISIEKFQNLKE